MQQNNINPADSGENILALQLSPNGISFSILCGSQENKRRETEFGDFSFEGDLATNLSRIVSDNAAMRAELDRVAILWNTERVGLVPARFYSETYIEETSDVSIVKHTDSLTVVVSPEVSGTVAVMNLDRDIFLYLNDTYGNKLEFYHPLLISVASAPKAGVDIVLDERIFYVAIFADSLQFADSFTYSSPADILYRLGETDKIYPLKQRLIRLSGRNAKSTGEILAGYYENLTVDENILTAHSLITLL